MCPEEDSASVEWARQKNGVWVNKSISSLEFLEKMRICSQQFIDRLVEANNFSPLEFHRVEGKYLPELNAVVFPIKVM